MKNFREFGFVEPDNRKRSIEIPETGEIQYEERTISLSDAVRDKYKLFGIDGYKIKTIYSLPQQLEQLSQQIYEEIRQRLGHDFKMRKNKQNALNTTELVDALNWMSYRLRRIKGFDPSWIPAEWYKQLLQVEYALTEGSTPSFGTVQHGMLAGEMGGRESYSGYDFEAAELLQGAQNRSIIFDKYNPMANRVDYFRTTEKGTENIAPGEETNTDIKVSNIWVSEPVTRAYHFSPVVFIYGNRNPVFKNYLEEILYSENEDITKPFGMIRNLPELSSNEVHYKLETVTDPRDLARLKLINSLAGPRQQQEDPSQAFSSKDAFGNLQLLLERKPTMQHGDLKFPVVFNHPRLPDFRLGAMAESVINFAKQEVIIPIVQK